MQVLETVKLKLFKPTKVKQKLLLLLSENYWILQDYCSFRLGFDTMHLVAAGISS